MIYTILTPVREVRKRLKIAGLILAINLNLLSLSIVAAAAAALHPLDYRDIGAYIRTPVIAFAAGDAPVNFIDIHREMAILEFASHARLNSKDKTKNLSLLRITPVYVDDTKGGTYKIHTRLGREKVVEFVFCSSSSPSLNPEVEGLESPDPRLTEKDFICCKPFRTDGATVDVLLSIANRHALSICSLPEILNARFGESTLAEESVEKRWYNSLQLPQRKTEIAELLPLPEVTNVTALRELSERLGDATKIVEPRHGIGSLCCSEQHSLLFLRDALKEAITSCEGSPLMKALVIHVHTTKHPCRICGLNLYRELQLLNADNAFFLPDGFDQGRLVEGFRILMLLTYRESYDDLPDSSTVFSAAGRFSDLLTPFLQADHVDRIGIVELKVKNTFELREVLPTHEPEEGAAAGAGGGST